ncbi:hypothetical protein CAPTEDRAFT_1231, partial [Capitella teleta]
MLSALQRIGVWSSRQLIESVKPVTENIRFSSKKAGKTTRNKRKRTTGQNYGWKKNDGDYVEAGMILYRQLGLKVYPGSHVGIGRDCTLFAQIPGRVIVTHETLSPSPESPLFAAVQSGQEFRKMFYHVVPDEQPKRFKLVSQI